MAQFPPAFRNLVYAAQSRTASADNIAFGESYSFFSLNFMTWLWRTLLQAPFAILETVVFFAFLPHLFTQFLAAKIGIYVLKNLFSESLIRARVELRMRWVLALPRQSPGEMSSLQRFVDTWSLIICGAGVFYVVYSYWNNGGHLNIFAVYAFVMAVEFLIGLRTTLKRSLYYAYSKVPRHTLSFVIPEAVSLLVIATGWNLVGPWALVWARAIKVTLGYGLWLRDIRRNEQVNQKVDEQLQSSKRKPYPLLRLVSLERVFWSFALVTIPHLAVSYFILIRLPTLSGASILYGALTLRGWMFVESWFALFRFHIEKFSIVDTGGRLPQSLNLTSFLVSPFVIAMSWSMMAGYFAFSNSSRQPVGRVEGALFLLFMVQGFLAYLDRKQLIRYSLRARRDLVLTSKRFLEDLLALPLTYRTYVVEIRLIDGSKSDKWLTDLDRRLQDTGIRYALYLDRWLILRSPLSEQELYRFIGPKLTALFAKWQALPFDHPERLLWQMTCPANIQTEISAQDSALHRLAQDLKSSSTRANADTSSWTSFAPRLVARGEVVKAVSSQYSLLRVNGANGFEFRLLGLRWLELPTVTKSQLVWYWRRENLARR